MDANVPERSSAQADASARRLRRALVRLLSTGAWAGRINAWACVLAAPTAPVDAVVAIPARNERARIERCLDACRRSAAVSGLRVRLVVLVNGTDDDTAARAAGWAHRRAFPVTVIDVDFAASLAHAGGARRLALDIASLDVPSNTLLLTTDADARPRLSWIRANAVHLHAGANLVCGHVALDPEEAAQLTAPVEAVGELEAAYGTAARELEHLLDPDPFNPWPHHGQAAGASLAIRVRDLAAVGGVPLVSVGEDRALVRRVRAAGMAVVHAADVEIEVSCRTHGRAAGGMADALRERAANLDPNCDESLEPAVALRARLVARASLRARWNRTEARAQALSTLGLHGRSATELARVERFAAAWDRIEEDVYAPYRVRLRASDLRRELPTLLGLLEEARTGRTGIDDPFVDVVGAASLPALTDISIPGALA